MKFHKQLYDHDPENGVWGDCHRTAIACVLDLHPSEVPHFADEDNAEAIRDEMDWLHLRGLHPINVPYLGELRDVLETVKTTNPDTYFILGGKSRNGTGHSVVGLNNEIIWDPSPKESGIVSPMSDGFYWITFFGTTATVKAAA